MQSDTPDRRAPPSPSGATPGAPRDDSQRTTPPTDLQAEDATASDTGQPGPDAARPAPPERPADSSQDRAARVMKQEHKTERGR